MYEVLVDHVFSLFWINTLAHSSEICVVNVSFFLTVPSLPFSSEAIICVFNARELNASDVDHVVIDKMCMTRRSALSKSLKTSCLLSLEHCAVIVSFVIWDAAVASLD